MGINLWKFAERGKSVRICDGGLPSNTGDVERRIQGGKLPLSRAVPVGPLALGSAILSGAAGRWANPCVGMSPGTVDRYVIEGIFGPGICRCSAVGLRTFGCFHLHWGVQQGWAAKLQFSPRFNCLRLPVLVGRTGSMVGLSISSATPGVQMRPDSE